MQVTPESNILSLASKTTESTTSRTTSNFNIHIFNVDTIYKTPPHEPLNVKSNSTITTITTTTTNNNNKVQSTTALINSISILLSKFTVKNINKNKNSFQSIKSFIIEILKRSKCNKQVTLLASLYFNNILSNENFNILPEFAKCPKRIFLSCLIISHKFLTDNTFSLTTWSQISGLNKKNLSDMERWCLNKLNYNLFIKSHALLNWNKSLLNLSFTVSSPSSSPSTSPAKKRFFDDINAIEKINNFNNDNNELIQKRKRLN